MKFAGDDRYHEQIKCYIFGRNWNRSKGAGYERKFESMSIGLAAL